MTDPVRVRLELKVVPGSSRDAVVGWLGDALKLKVRAPPEKGRANKAVETLLAETLDLPRGSVQIVSGHSSSSKTAEFSGLTEAELHRRLQAVFQP